MVIPADMVQARFGAAFKLEDGNRVVGYDANGSKIFSKAKPGDLADFDEALEILVDGYAQRDSILKGKNGAGGGSSGGSGNGGDKGSTWTRPQFDAASPAQRMEFSKAGGKVVDAN
jgi:hypothetical protein